ncbi:hypothetical protein GJAV_G00147240 [Gymnothorax javanicus]|nr:hypothetical protein GJAV_G00147240 [Gymnothorax javanicus]
MHHLATVPSLSSYVAQWIGLRGGSSNDCPDANSRTPSTTRYKRISITRRSFLRLNVDVGNGPRNSAPNSERSLN